MRDKQEILTEIRQALSSGVISEDDLRPLVVMQTASVVATTPSLRSSDKLEKLSVVDVMFYIAGLILFAAIMTFIAQSWGEGGAFLHIVLSAGIGAGMWLVAYYLIKSPEQSDIRKGLTNSLLLTGSLSVIVGGYIVSNEIVAGFGNTNFIVAAVTLVALSAAHIGFDRMIKRDFVLLVGTILGVAAFPVLLFELLQQADAPLDAWCFIITIAAGVLAYATRVVAKFNTDRPNIKNALDPLAVFIALISIYIASFGELQGLWLIVLICGVFGIFYLSIVTQSKELLGSGSFFLVLSVLTIVFKYFFGYDVTLSLIIAAIGLLGSAAVASTINKRYFKNPSK